MWIPNIRSLGHRWWFLFFNFHPETWGNDPIRRAYFSNGLVQPPTSSTWTNCVARRCLYKLSKHVSGWCRSKEWIHARWIPVLSILKLIPTTHFLLSTSQSLDKRIVWPQPFCQKPTLRNGDIKGLYSSSYALEDWTKWAMKKTLVGWDI